jgi:hypothetical protein
MAKNEGPFPPVSEERLEFGASPLHFGLQAFEALLHIAYKQDVKTFKVRNPEDKAIVAESTVAVKSAFERELGLKVDCRRDGGFGNTNTGNVARKAFANAKKQLPFVVSQQCWCQILTSFGVHLSIANPSIQKNLENCVKKPLSSDPCKVV